MASKPPPAALMLNLTIGHWVARLVAVAAELQLADLLKNGPRTVEQLAAAAGVHPRGKVLVVDNVIQPGNDPSWGKLLDIQMLIIGGRERTKREFAAMFARAGLRLTRVVPTKCPLSIVEGVRA